MPMFRIAKIVWTVEYEINDIEMEADCVEDLLDLVGGLDFNNLQGLGYELESIWELDEDGNEVEYHAGVS